MSFPLRLRDLALAFSVGLALVLTGAPAHAIEAPPGSKNFTPPADVPNYFSNESGPFRGGAAAHAAQPGAVPVVAAPASHGGRAVAARRTSRHHHPAHLAKAGGHTRLAHGQSGGYRQVAHAGSARRGHAPGPRVAHAAGPKVAHVAGSKVAHAAAGSKVAHAATGHPAGKTVAAKSRAASSKGKHPARAHG
jgi:hypothetical protein